MRSLSYTFASIGQCVDNGDMVEHQNGDDPSVAIGRIRNRGAWYEVFDHSEDSHQAGSLIDLSPKQ